MNLKKFVIKIIGSLGVHPGNSGQFSKSSSGCTTASSGSTEIQQINSQPANPEYQDENMRKVRFDKVHLLHRVWICFSSFLTIPNFLEQILMEHIELICSSESKISFISAHSVRIPSRNRDIFEKPQQLNAYSSVNKTEFQRNIERLKLTKV